MNKPSIKQVIVTVLALIMSVTLLCSCGGSGSDPWDYSKPLPNSEMILTDADKLRFTGKEWTGKLYQKDVDGNIVNQSDIVRINTLDYHSVGTVVFDSVEKALEAARSYDRTGSKYYKLLTGENNTWQLAVYKNEADAAEAGVLNDFYKTSYNMATAPVWEGENKIYNYNNAYYGGFKDVTLPASWQTQGFDFPIYTNVTYPWADGAYGNERVFPPTTPTVTNPVGFYRYEFDVDPTWISENRRVYISFGGVESAYYVYVNGHQVGYSEDTFDAADFDITPYLNKDGKKNLLAVKVYRWCDGSYFEDQDFLRLAGIFRDVYLYSTPGVRISDYTVVTDLDNNYTNATLKISVDVDNTTLSSASGLKLDVKLFDADKNNLFASSSMGKAVPSLESGNNVTVDMSKKVTAPHLWSDEDPYLYTLVISMYDSNGAYYGSISQQLGFRELTFTPTEGTSENDYYQTVLLNGQPIMLKGTDRHETNPETGRYLSLEMEENDVKIMKSLNVNAVRTSHYPDDENFYNMCDKYGIIVMGECNVESHYNVSGADTDECFMNVIKDRIRAHTIAYKNRTCILFWSMGNESIGGTTAFIQAIQELKQRDPTRPVHFESQGSGGGVDIASTMYANIGEMENRGNWQNHMPYLQCEYAHAMGNSIGNLYEYWEPIRKYDNVIGAFIWDFVDQSVWTEIPEGKYDHFGNGKYLAFGGCWADNPNSGDFCQNGFISADRTIQPEAIEVKYVYQSVWFTGKKLSASNNEISVYNEYRFTDLSAFDFKYELLRNGVAVDTGSFEVSCKPLETVTVAVPFKLPENSEPNSEYLLSVYAVLKNDTLWESAGYKVALEQFEVKADSESKSADTSLMGAVNVSDDSSSFTVTGDGFEVVIDKSKGFISKYTVNGEDLFEKGPVPNFNRARINNDNMWGTLDSATVSSVDKFEHEVSADGKSVTITERLKLSAGNCYETMIYTVYGGGQIQVECKLELTKDVSELLKYGSVMVLPVDYENMTYYGNGEADTYNDRRRGSPIGVYTQTVSDSFFPYGKPQDTGNKTGIRYIALTSDQKNTGILVAAKGVLEASALHYSVSDLSNARYTYALPEIKSTYLNIDFGQRGTGGASCGPETLNQYKLLNDGTKYEYTYTIIPFDKNSDDIDTLVGEWRN